MKTILLPILFFLSITNIRAQSLVWEHRYNGYGDDPCLVGHDVNGNVYCGVYLTGYDVQIYSLDASGNQNWQLQMTPSDNTLLNRNLSWMVNDQNGNVYAAGQPKDSITNFITKYRPDGSVEWRRQEDSMQYDGVILDNIGDPVVFGQKMYNGSQLYKYVFLKYTKAGTLQWRSEVPFLPLNSLIHQAAVDASNHLFFASSYQDAGSSTLGLQLIKTDEHGAVIFDKVIVLDADAAEGNYYPVKLLPYANKLKIVAYSDNIPGPSLASLMYTAETNDTGRLNWVRKDTANYGSLPMDAVLDRFGNMYVGGLEYKDTGFISIFKGFIAKYADATPGMQTFRKDADAVGEWRKIEDLEIVNNLIYASGSRKSSSSDFHACLVSMNLDGVMGIVYDLDSSSIGKEQFPAIHVLDPDSCGLFVISHRKDLFSQYFMKINDCESGLFNSLQHTENEELTVQVYPNPFEQVLSVDLVGLKTDQTYTASIFDMQGKLCRKAILHGGQESQIQVAELSRGSYLLLLQDQNGNAIKRKVLVK